MDNYNPLMSLEELNQLPHDVLARLAYAMSVSAVGQQYFMKSKNIQQDYVAWRNVMQSMYEKMPSWLEAWEYIEKRTEALQRNKKQITIDLTKMNPN